MHRVSEGRVERVIIAVAPVAHAGTFLPEGTMNPVTADQVADEARRCADAGASIIHLHVRDESGRIVEEMDSFTRTLDRITGETRLVINASTGGASNLSREARCVALTDPRVEVASLNMGSTNLHDGVYINTAEDIRYWANRMREVAVVPELEVFAPGMVYTSFELADEGTLPEDLHFNFCLGFPGATPADPQELAHLVSLVSGRHGAGRRLSWGFLHEGMTDYRLVAAALGMGASVVRVGFEDGGYLRADQPARTNAELVDQLVGLVRATGLEPATPAEARRALGLKDA